MFIHRFEEGYTIVCYVKGLECLVFKVIPQSSKIDGLFLNDMESLCPVLAVMTKLANCCEILWVCAWDCLAEELTFPSCLFPAYATFFYPLMPSPGLHDILREHESSLVLSRISQNIPGKAWLVPNIFFLVVKKIVTQFTWHKIYHFKV